jgi:hypothetical protein
MDVPLARVFIMLADSEKASTTTTMSGAPSSEFYNREISIPTPLVDVYGQCNYEEWPGKIHSDKDFADSVKKEQTELDKVTKDVRKFDRFGGLMEPPIAEATGFFRIERINGKHWFITPEGHRFYMSGIDCLGYHELTPVFEDNGKVRSVFEAIPDKKLFPEAYVAYPNNGQAGLCFQASNLKRKYGKDFVTKWHQMMTKRMQAWGFNAASRWGGAYEALKVPYTQHLMIDKVAKIDNPCRSDPFDPNFVERVAQTNKAMMLKLKNDRMLIGYCVENENQWVKGTVINILKMDAKSPAKGAFIDLLLERNGGDIAKVAEKLGVKAGSRAELLNQPLNVSDGLDPDIKAFLRLAGKKYYSGVAEGIKRYDANHLMLGSAVLAGTGPIDWVVGGAPYVDVLSFTNYQPNTLWLKPYESSEINKPVILLEFSFSVGYRGMGAGWNAMGSEEGRGEGYKNLVTAFASHPLTVGFGWFKLYDSAACGNGLGEAYNQGLLDVTDQPYYHLVEKGKEVNRIIYDLHSGTSGESQ